MTRSGAQTQVQSVPVTVSRVLRRRRRSWGAVEQLPSGRFRARVLGPDGRYVSAPTTFAARTDAAVWLDVQHADLVRGLWKAPNKSRSAGSDYTVGEYLARWIRPGHEPRRSRCHVTRVAPADRAAGSLARTLRGKQA
jgi:hypothetical protein